MSLDQKLDSLVETMRATKESWVATQPENTDLAIYAHFWRGEEMVASVVCHLDRDAGLQAAQIGARGFNASTVALTFESYNSELPESPITGEGWRPGEMQYVAQTQPQAFEKNWVHECITTSIHERGGGFALRGLPYRIKDHRVEWLEESLRLTSEEGGGGAGFMFELLQEAMEAPMLDDLLSDASEQDSALAMVLKVIADEEVKTYHADAATVQFLTDRQLIIAAMLSAEPGSKREQLLSERFGAAEQ
jgi:hypothetical protein